MAQPQRKAGAGRDRLYASEPLVDAFIQHHVRIQGLTAGEVKKFAPFLQKIDADIRARLSGDALTDYSRRRLLRQLTALDGSLADAFEGYKSVLTKDLKALADHEAAFTAGTMEAHIEGVEFDVPSASQIRAAIKSRPLSVRGPDGGKVLDALVDDWTKTERNAVINAIKRGVVEGQTNSQIVQVIRGTRAAKYGDGILAMTDRHARAITHTAIEHVSTVARQETFAANDDIVKGARWIATLDMHTCPVCRSLDQHVFALDAGPRPPIHINDRCTTVPVLVGEFDQYTKGALRPAVANGEASQVSASVSYYVWLKRQTAAFQDEVLGPTRGKLFRDGGLSAKRFSELMLDRTFQPLTLSEMQALEPAAFRKAGI
jgi:SPP1 gp7 family putative phage head morphogenesis protein